MNYTYPRLLYVQIYTYPSLSPNIPTPNFPSNPTQNQNTTNQISFLHGVTTDVFLLNTDFTDFTDRVLCVTTDVFFIEHG